MYTSQKAAYQMQKREYSAERKYGNSAEKKRTIKYLGCTCGGCSPCRGTCRTFTTE